MPGIREEESVEAPSLSKELRGAFAQAAQDDRLWAEAKADPQAFLHKMGVADDGLGVAFLDAERHGDWVRYTSAGNQLVLEMNCPPERMWWHFCRKLMRVCEKRTVEINGELQVVEVNCFTVCEESIWDERPSLPKRPPYSPIPLLEGMARAGES